MSTYTTILKHLANNPLSLADLLPQTDVSLPTLRKAVQELTDNRWICVVGQAETNGGRPAKLLGLDTDHYAIIGVHIQLPGLRLITTDLIGNILHEEVLFQREAPAPEQVIQAIIHYVRHQTSKLANRHIVGIGIAAPGFIDQDSGAIISVGRVEGWQNIPITQRLRIALNLPTAIANDVDCMALAEYQSTSTQNINNLVYVGFDEGVKVSLFVEGVLYKGSFGNPGLIADRFLRVPNTNFDQQEQHLLLSISGLCKWFETRYDQLTDQQRLAYAPLLEVHSRQRLQLIFSKEYRGLPICRHLIAAFHGVLSAAIANIIYILQPDHIALGGMLSMLPDEIFGELVSQIRSHLRPLFANHIHIDQAKLRSENIAAIGASHRFIEAVILENGYLTAQIGSN
jgi:predicted NBD/HSP70 family sugar kinase